MESLSNPLAPPAMSAMPRRLRTWPAALTLLFLSPIVGEMISGSTPPLLFLQLFSLIFLPTLYGISAILIREIIVRRRLGWGNALLMGAAFGIFQEALVVQTWFTFRSPHSPSHSLGTYGVLWQTNWDWALNLTIYHAVVSITVPLMLIDLFYPRRTSLPWLGRKSMALLAGWLLVLCGLLAYGVGFRNFVADGYTSPPLYPYLTAGALTGAFFVLGCFLRFPVARPDSARPVPKLWTVRGTACCFMILSFLLVAIVPATHLPALASMLVSVLLAGGLWRLRSWSARPGWNARHRLAVATGIIMYFTFFWGPFVEFGIHLPERTGLTVTNLLIFLGLMFFDRRMKHRAIELSSSSTGPPPTVPLVSTGLSPVESGEQP